METGATRSPNTTIAETGEVMAAFTLALFNLAAIVRAVFDLRVPVGSGRSGFADHSIVASWASERAPTRIWDGGQRRGRQRRQTTIEVARRLERGNNHAQSR